jgi:hypothetical protein
MEEIKCTSCGGIMQALQTVRCRTCGNPHSCCIECIYKATVVGWMGFEMSRPETTEWRWRNHEVHIWNRCPAKESGLGVALALLGERDAFAFEQAAEKLIQMLKEPKW